MLIKEPLINLSLHRFGLARPFSGFALFTTALILNAPDLVAQDNIDLSFLLFEPAAVHLQTESVDPPAELAAPLPEAGTIKLQAWLQSSHEMAVPPDTIDSDIARYQQAITRYELEEGPFSPNLPQHLMDQAAAYEAKGDSKYALDLYERALHIIRVNQGLYALEQEPVVNRIISTYLSRGNLEAANSQQEYLFYLHSKTAANAPASAMLDAIQNYADWNIFAFRALVSVNPVYKSTTSFNVETAASRNFLDMQTFRAESLLKAQSGYQQMIEIVRNEAGSQDPRLVPLQQQLALSCFLYLSNFSINDEFQINQSQRPYDVTAMPLNSLCTRVGRQAIEDRITLLQEISAPAQELVKAKLDMVDWLIFSRKRMEALNYLQDAYNATATTGILPEADVDALFNPELPVAIPGFGLAPYSRATLNIPSDLDLEYNGYIDIEFSLSQYGATQSVKILDKSADTPEPVESALERYLRRAMFRPRFSNGLINNPEIIQLRYYYTY